MIEGTKVKIKNTNSVFDGKEGLIETKNINDDEISYLVFVDFIQGENKKIRQEFKEENLEEII